MRQRFALFAAIPFLLASCVSSQIRRSEYDNGFKAADSQCIELQKKIGGYVVELQTENGAMRYDLIQKNYRLRKFNQLNDDGTLRPENAPKAKPKPSPVASPVSAPAPAPTPSPTPGKK